MRPVLLNRMKSVLIQGSPYVRTKVTIVLILKVLHLTVLLPNFELCPNKDVKGECLSSFLLLITLVVLSHVFNAKFLFFEM